MKTILIAFTALVALGGVSAATEPSAVPPQTAEKAAATVEPLTPQFPPSGEIQQMVNPLPADNKKIIQLSSLKPNLFICDAPIKDVVRDKSEGLRVAYLKGKPNVATVSYVDKAATAPSGLYLYCGSDIFSVLAFPKNITQQTVYFKTSGVAPSTEATLSGLDYDMRLKLAITRVVLGKLPENARVRVRNEALNVYQELATTLTRTIRFDGEGVTVKEYSVKNTGAGTLNLDERQFNRPEFSAEPDAIVVDPLILTAGSVGVVYVVEGGLDGQ